MANLQQLQQELRGINEQPISIDNGFVNFRNTGTGFEFRVKEDVLDSARARNPDSWLRDVMGLAGGAEVVNPAYAYADQGFLDGMGYGPRTVSDLNRAAIKNTPSTIGNFFTKAIKSPLGVLGLLSLPLGAAALSGALGGTAGATSGALGSGATAEGLLAAPAGLGSSAGFTATQLGSGAVGGGLSSYLGAAGTGALKGSAIGGGLSAIQGGNLSDVLKSAAIGGATGGAFAGGSAALSDYLKPTTLGSGATAQGLLNAPVGVTKGFSPATITGINSGGASSMFGLSDALKLGGGVYSNYANNKANKDILNQLMAANTASQQALSPYTEGGAAAQKQLSDALSQGFNYNDYLNSDAYNFQLSEGQKALQQQLANTGMQQSGAAQKAATQYAQGLASQSYGDAYNQWLNNLSQLQTAAGQGQNAATSLSDVLSGAGSINAGYLNAKQANQNELLAGILGSDTFSNLLGRIF